MALRGAECVSELECKIFNCILYWCRLLQAGLPNSSVTTCIGWLITLRRSMIFQRFSIRFSKA